MLRNYVKIALRTLWRQKGITAINVLGLAAGMAVCLLVGLLFWDQGTHDDFHPDSERLHRVTTTHQGNNPDPYASSPARLAPVLRTGVTGIEAATRLRRTDRTVSQDNRGFRAQGLYAEPQFFDLFGFRLEAGSAAEALSDPYSAVITQDLATRLYGDQNPMGRTFQLTEVGSFTVTGVVNRDAYRSHLDFDVLYSFATIRQTRSDEIERDWTQGLSYYTYLRLAPGTTPEDVGPSLRSIEDQYLPPESAEGTPPSQFQLQPLSALPLSEALPNEIATGMLPASVGYFLGILAILVLLAAGFNYVNLSTARSLTRAREVGIRKTVGARRRQVMGQFVAEGAVVSLLALSLALVLLQGLVPLYNQLSIHQTLAAQIDVRQGPLVYGVFVLFALAVGGLAGLYPAWHLSKFRPAQVLKASGQSETPGLGWTAPRKVLTVLQFTVAIVVIVTAALVYQQVQHMKQRDKEGVRTDHVGRVALQDAPLGPFWQEARGISGVEQVGAVRNLPLSGRTGGRLPLNREKESVSARYYPADHEALQILSIPLTTTDDWSEARFEGGQVIVANEAATRALGFESAKSALGAPVMMDTTQVRIAAITPNFYTRFTESPNLPVVFRYDPVEFRAVIAEVTPSQEQAALTALSNTWQQFDSVNPPEVRRYDEIVRSGIVMPIAEAGGVLALVAALAALIGCLGLLGIATYTVQTRTREIGIRKALGATVPSVVGLLSKDFLWLVGAAVGLGLPLAWWLNRLWLRGFAYRIELGVWKFALSAVGLGVLAFLAVGSQTVRAARLDPARTLRDE
ncbi:ABC transporter permease [Salinibacter ruber]|uniref:ABC transport system permease protein n=1 Tax=Salinibacter ruber TaxID=146919 RepID=A0A9X2U2L5_9BACT|nr:ABC transporter permease [Salinibacter ruber]MCS3858684.1 putative ABC transport system permease protein [Salinibacter ruber]MCS3865637.1 putative ABC transport system permease protein [Salinibacter ruber]MCS4151093.1 putative ABC transport system permease protein [Salinibacter ruber]